MKDLITEARELCERATPGPWEWNKDRFHDGYSGITGKDNEEVLFPNCCNDGDDGAAWFEDFPGEADRDFFIRSRTLVPELCDALEKAQEQNKQLLYEVCKLACESLERDRTLARLEAEVAAAVGEGCDYCLSTWPERAADGFSDIWHGNKLSVGYGVYREIGYCPMCGKRLEDKPCG